MVVILTATASLDNFSQCCNFSVVAVFAVIYSKIIANGQLSLLESYRNWRYNDQNFDPAFVLVAFADALVASVC